MSAAAILALRQAIVARLADDAVLADLMGGSVRLHDEPPRAARGLYAVFGEVNARDWSSGSGRGDDQTLSLVVWSSEGGAATGLAVAARIATLLHEADLPVAGHDLVTLRVVATDVARDRATGLARITLRLRALTQVL